MIFFVFPFVNFVRFVRDTLYEFSVFERKKSMLDLWTQRDLRWQNDSMALPNDRLGDLGCLVTCFSNLTIATLKNPIPPGLFNTLLKLNKGYLGLAKGDCPKGQESYILYPVVEFLLNCKIEVDVKHDFTDYAKTYYIGKFEYSTGLTHFVNITNYKRGKDMVEIYDVFFGKRSTCNKRDFKRIMEVGFN